MERVAETTLRYDENSFKAHASAWAFFMAAILEAASMPCIKQAWFILELDRCHPFRQPLVSMNRWLK
ncbi:MAG: hypothetical protein CMJ40_06200 [Phycisphaerae bacterium]|nr:hypothetical protein [Phycisphaerae bacterium]